MKVRALICILCIVNFFTIANGQTCPPNLDFEKGDFTNWECFIGFTDTIGGKNRMVLNPSPAIPNRHTIIAAASNPGMDYFGNFPIMCPFGGDYSVKLGNEGTGAQAEAISYTFQVPSTIDTFTFTYFYAVVFEDPQHTQPEQPRFFVTAYDVASGALINCASYDYISTAALPGFERSTANPAVLFKNWTPTSLQFAGLGGHTVRLEFRTADCTRSGHFGYAYLDVASACSNILATAPYCLETNSLILDAPFGFATYTWYNEDFSAVVGSGQSMTLSPPPATTGVFHVDVVPYPGFGCRDTLQALVTPLPVPDTPDAVTEINLCQFQSAMPLSAKVLPKHQLLWYTTPTGGVPVINAPRPPTNVAGVFKYYVSQKALFGCEGFRREITVNVIPTPLPAFTINSPRQCQNGNSFVFSSVSTNLQNPSYAWEYGNGDKYSSADTFATYTFPASGNFYVKLKATNSNTCTAERTQMITVVPKPVATFTFPSPICENQTLVTLTDRSSVPSGLSVINNWWWSINGQIANGQAPPAATALAGPLPVKLVVTTTEGCRSDTNATTLTIRYAPLPAFGIGDLLCNNETIRFTDQSRMPAPAIGEIITKWNWTLDATINANTQHLATHFNAGMHQARLIAESNFGCRSVPMDRSFEIHPKPIVQLDISDSCAFAPVIYEASDLSGNVAKWNWNFGDGFETRSHRIVTTYHAEGNRPFTLLTLTAKGCKDTINRPFRIYENKSHAGRDTVAAFNEPVLLHANGETGMEYTWTPSLGLDKPTIERPTATLDRDQRYHLYTVTTQGCKKYSQIFVKRYAGPELYVPNAFTPNGDGLNDKLTVKPVGILSFGYLAVYNRWGQLLYRTSNHKEGWDGRINGKPATTDTYVYVVQATDYRGKPMVRKGTVILMR